MKARVRVNLADTPETAVAQFRAMNADTEPFPEAHQYGLALALSAAGRYQEAKELMQALLDGTPTSHIYLISLAEIGIAQRDTSWIIPQLERAVMVFPDNVALTLTLARALMTDQKAHIAASLLDPMTKREPNNPLLWYWLAEIEGLAGNIQNLHRARGEYFLLHGIADEAEKQFRYALKLSENDFVAASVLEDRLKSVYEFRARLDNL